jgi:hypothetical protein
MFVQLSVLKSNEIFQMIEALDLCSRAGHCSFVLLSEGFQSRCDHAVAAATQQPRSQLQSWIAWVLWHVLCTRRLQWRALDRLFATVYGDVESLLPL